MTLQGDRAEFVRRVWDYVVPTTGTNYPPYEWVPGKLLDSLGGKVTRRDLEKIDLNDAATCILCFARIHRSLNRNWSRLIPEFTTLIERSLNELNLWEGFDRDKIRVSDSQRDVAKVRFDVADVVFASKKALLNSELKNLEVDLEDMRMRTNTANNEARIIHAVEQHVTMRAHIDLAVLTIQNIPRGARVIERIASRFRMEREDQYLFLREMLKNSTLWNTPDGNAYFGDEIPGIYSINEMYDAVAPRLAGFNDTLEKLELILEREVPPREIVNECSEIMRRAIMPSQNVTTNIHVTNSQVGVLNTGTLQDVQSIDASITTLKSQGDMDVGDAFRKITEGVVGDDTLAEADKSELLSNIKYLTEMAAKKEERNSSVVKSVLRSVSDGIGAAGPAVKALLPLIPVIAKFFGL
jgi:hypothetical protein